MSKHRYTIHTDIQIAKRLRIHSVVNRLGEHERDFRNVGDVFDYLYDKGETSAMFDTAGDVWLITFEKSPIG